MLSLASLLDVSVELSEDESTARVEATGRAKVAGQGNSEVQDFLFFFEKTEDEGWLITKVASVDALH